MTEPRWMRVMITGWQPFASGTRRKTVHIQREHETFKPMCGHHLFDYQEHAHAQWPTEQLHHVVEHGGFYYVCGRCWASFLKTYRD